LSRLRERAPVFTKNTARTSIQTAEKGEYNDGQEGTVMRGIGAAFVLIAFVLAVDVAADDIPTAAAQVRTNCP
jgi:hypothetical protein